MAFAQIHTSRVNRMLASVRVVARKSPRDVAWPVAHPQPADLVALYHACDGLELDDGTHLFGKGELRDVTEWLVLEKGLGWSDDLVVIGERRDVVLVLDLDVHAARAGGGALETGADDLGAFERVAADVVGYLMTRVGVTDDDVAAPPEVAARRAAAAGDLSRLEAELARPWYPGDGRLFASLALELGAAWAVAGDEERAMVVFARSVDARVLGVGRGGQAGERAAAWWAAARSCRARGATIVADRCEARASRGEER
jgi:hypothetical protein